MNSHRLGRKTEKLNEIDGQHSFFDEVENCCELDVDEPELQIVIRKARRKKKKDQRELDLEGLPEKKISHPLTDEQLDAHYGSGNWRRLPDDTYARLRFTLASWTVERHSAAVAVGKSGDHQDEFLRGDPQ